MVVGPHVQNAEMRQWRAAFCTFAAMVRSSGREEHGNFAALGLVSRASITIRSSILVSDCAEFASGTSKTVISLTRFAILRVGLNRRNFDRRTSFGRFWDGQRASKRAKASSVPVGLRERSPSALSVDAFSTLSLGPFFRPFQAFGLASAL